MRSARFLSIWLTAVWMATPILALAAEPAINSLTPASATAGGAAFTLTIDGLGYLCVGSATAAKWNGVELATSCVTSTELTASVPASLIAAAGTASITVTTANGSSSGVTFTIDPAAIVSQNSTTALTPVSAAADEASFAPAPAATVFSQGATASRAAASTVSTEDATVVTVPAITSLSPTSAIAGSAAFTLTIKGSNFTSSSVASWGSTALTTTYKSATQVTASVPASLIATAGTVSVTVSTSGSASAAATFTVNPPLATITSLSPTTVVAGSATFTMTVNGSNFISGSLATVVRLGNTGLVTTYVSSTQVTAVVPASLLLGYGTTSVTVITVSGVSAGFAFIITPPTPVATEILPVHVPAGYGSFTLTVEGYNFMIGSTVYWGTTPLVTTYVRNVILTAVVPASLVASSGTAQVTVTDSAGTSSALTFNINLPLPVITSLSRNSVAAGSAQFTLTINGTSFVSSVFSAMGGTRLKTTYVSATQLTAVVPASLIAIAGVTSVFVYTTNGGLSMAVPFTITPAVPAITSLTPNTIPDGYTGVMMKVNGTAFTLDAAVYWGSTLLDTVYQGPTLLSTCIPPILLQSPGTGSITVVNSVGTSAPATFTITLSPPQINMLNPGFASAGGSGFTLTISGNNYTAASTAKWGSTPLAVTYVSSTTLTAAIPASLITSVGTAGITVTTTAGVSSTAIFTVNPTPRIVTTTLPSGTVGLNYSGFVKVTGGVPGYNWSATGLPASLTYNMTFDNTLTISGTPTASGPVTFQVSAQDQFGSIAGPVTYTINFAAGASSANNGNLNGSYTCLIQGYIDPDSSRWASVASFQADGHGNISNGVFDTNSTDIGSGAGVLAGSYNLGADNNGTASIHTIYTENIGGNQTTQWAIAATSSAQPAQEFRMVEIDDLGTLPSGEQATANCYLATPSAFVASTISGSSFAFGLDGENNSGVLKATAGLFSATGSKVSGSFDSVLGGSGLQSTSFTANYSTPDPTTGRFTITLNNGAGTAGATTGFTVYIIDAKRMFILDNTSDDGEQVGNMRAQQQASYSGASLNGPFVLSVRGAEFASGSAPSGYYAALYQGAGDGAGNLTIHQSYADNGGSYSAGKATGGPTALTFDATHPGRATFPSASGTTYLYLFDTSSGFAMSAGSSGAVDSGWLEAQTQTTFTDAAVAGNYLLGQQPLLSWTATGSVGAYDVASSGTLTGAATTISTGVLAWDQPVSLSYAWDTTASGTGSFLISNGSEGESSCAVISATRFVCTPQTDTVPSIEILQQ